MNPLSLDKFVAVEKNNSHTYSTSDIVNICKRMNNPKRDFLFVNSLQGKHLPVDPNKSFTLFGELADEIKKQLSPTEKVVVIGFAETATAIGRFIASSLTNCVSYMQTTREHLENAVSLLDFKEEHSHATEQYLYGNAYNFASCDRIIFVDDEISTGNTVLNFIKALEASGIHAKYGVATLLNWQDDEWTEKFNSLNIDTYFILRGKLKNLKAKVDVPIEAECVHPEYTSKLPHIVSLGTLGSYFIMERISSRPCNLDAFSNYVYSQIIPFIPNFMPCVNDKVLILGTEEFMFTPMMFGKKLSENLDVNVRFHATTRSPIETSNFESYAIHKRYPIASCYDEKRKTFLYNLKKYDKVYIITDMYPSLPFIKDISAALVSAGCDINDVVIIHM